MEFRLQITAIYEHPPNFTIHRFNASSLDKMAAILTDGIFNDIFLNENARIPIKISLKYVPMIPIGNKSVLIRVMAGRRTGDKPLPEPMVAQFMRH